jgi:hypothetical protein
MKILGRWWGRSRELAALKKCVRAPEMSGEEMTEQFSLAPESKMFRALHQFIEQEIQMEVSSAAAFGLPSERKLEHTNRKQL